MKTNKPTPPSPDKETNFRSASHEKNDLRSRKRIDTGRQQSPAVDPNVKELQRKK